MSVSPKLADASHSLLSHSTRRNARHAKWNIVEESQLIFWSRKHGAPVINVRHYTEKNTLLIAMKFIPRYLDRLI